MLTKVDSSSRKEEKIPIQLKLLFGVIFFTNLMVNMDHGIFPACTEEIRRDINIPNTSLGIMGSIVYLGLVVGKDALISNCIYRFDVCHPRTELPEH